MSIHNLKSRMSDVAGIETLTMGLEAGRIVFAGLVTRPRSMPRPLMPNEQFGTIKLRLCHRSLISHYALLANMTAAQILLPPKFVPVFTGEGMYDGVYVGRAARPKRSRLPR